MTPQRQTHIVLSDRQRFQFLRLAWSSLPQTAKPEDIVARYHWLLSVNVRRPRNGLDA